jgi:hypothetical protein
MLTDRAASSEKSASRIGERATIKASLIHSGIVPRNSSVWGQCRCEEWDHGIENAFVAGKTRANHVQLIDTRQKCVRDTRFEHKHREVGILGQTSSQDAPSSPSWFRQDEKSA